MRHSPLRGRNPRHPVSLAYLVAARLTATWRELPSAFFLGGTKCGSSSITAALHKHPDVCGPLTKELHYLQQLPGFSTYYDDSGRLFSLLWGRSNADPSTYSMAGYRKFFPLSARLRRAEQRSGRRITVVDWDPFNLYCSVAAARVKQLASRPKFVVALREPVARAYSDYCMWRSWQGDAGENRSFEQAVDDELDGTCKTFRNRYLNQSLYAKALRPWLRHFSRDQFHFVISERLFANPERELERLGRFLEIRPTLLQFGRSNAQDYAQPLEQATRKRLQAYFRGPSQELFDLIGPVPEW